MGRKRSVFPCGLEENMQTLLTEGDLLDENGKLVQAGYATSLVKKYDRSKIKASKLRIKEWDYYAVTDGKIFLCLTIADIGYISMASVNLVDTPARECTTGVAVGLLPLGKTGFPSSYERGDVTLRVGKRKLSFVNDGIYRRLYCEFPKFKDGKTLVADITLSDPQKDNMVIATPFKEKDTAFYYNAKLNCLTASGYMELGGARLDFKPESALAVLDWGRGVWTYENTWYWGSLSCYVDGVKFGFNLGYGFGDTSAASENMLFYDGAAHKLDNVKFEIPMVPGGKTEDFEEEWKIKDDKGRLDLVFRPDLDRKDGMSLGFLCTKQHQVFGGFYGTAVLDDGKEITLNGQRGFAEKVYNKW